MHHEDELLTPKRILLTTSDLERACHAMCIDLSKPEQRMPIGSRHGSAEGSSRCSLLLLICQADRESIIVSGNLEDFHK